MKLLIANQVVIAKCIQVNPKGWFFAQNGDSKDIFCHVNQGGLLTVTRAGYLGVEHIGSLPVADINQEVVLVRLNQDPANDGYTKARFWTTKLEWDAHKWAFNGGARVTYRAFAYLHRTNGKFQSNTRNEVELTQGTLIEITSKHLRTGVDTQDILMSGYHTNFMNRTLSYQVRWEQLEADRTWTECADPRPPANTISQVVNE